MSPVSTVLLVPIQLQALLVNPRVRAQGFQRWNMDYAQLSAFGSPEPEPFGGLDAGWADDPGNDGVHLQWILPAALRAGWHDAADGATRYPAAPNRWLVFRTAEPPDGAPAPVRGRGWIVESDYLGPDGLSAYLDPFAGTPVPRRIGRIRPLDGWHEPGSPAPFLTAVAPGNLAFAAYQPHSAGVFSLHDPADDLEPGWTVSYLVAGWYADPAADPLAPARQPGGLAARLAELGWAVPADRAAGPADTTVCHGAIRTLTYSRTAVGERPAAAALAVGNNSADAVTALVRAQAARRPDAALAPDLIEAFQYDLLHTLDEPDGPARLTARIHDAWFAARPGGSVWQVVAVPPAGSGPAAQPAAVADPSWLAGLNRAQAAYDEAARRLAALQRELYGLWWKRGRWDALGKPAVLLDAQFANGSAPAYAQSPAELAQRVAALRRELDGRGALSERELAAQVASLRRELEQARAASPESAATRDHVAQLQGELYAHYDLWFTLALDPAGPDSLAGRVAALQREVARIRATIPWGANPEQLADAVADYVSRHPLPPGTELKRGDLPPFRSVPDPVVVVAGVGATAFDENLGVGADGLLPCRFGDQTVNALTLPLTNPVGPDGLLPDGRRPSPQHQTPETVTVTAQQASSLTRAAAMTTALHGQPAPVSVLAALQAEAYFLDPGHAGTFATLAARIAGTPWALDVLTDAAVELITAARGLTGTVPALRPQAWAQPWAPLFLEWQVIYRPLPPGAQWSFDGTRYHWEPASGAAAEAAEPPVRLSGRSLLTPQPAAAFQARLAGHLATLPDRAQAALGALAAAIDSWDLLSQALSGFNEQLALRDAGSLRAPGGGVDGAGGGADAAGSGPSMAGLIGGGAVAMPMPDGAVAGDGSPEPGGFQPLRAGQFAFTRVAVVDRFGQSVEAVSPSDAADFVPVAGRGLGPQAVAGPPPAERYLQLPPRLLEPSRLTVRFAPGGPGTGHDAAGPDGGVGGLGGSAPVCAWIVPSPLDQALACYAPDGAALGELSETAGPDGARVSWLPAPGSAHPEPASLVQRYPVLSRFLHGVTAAGPAAFADLMRTIDATLWTIDPPGGGDETYLAAMAGRPLALVCAALHGESAHPPRTDPAWTNTFAPIPSPVPRVPFPVRPGDAALRGDGLIGYLEDGQNARFRAAFRPPGLTAGCVEPITPATLPTIRFAEPGTAEPTYLTLLMDPQLPVHLVTDVLPVVTVRLPQRDVADAMAALELTVRFGPLLTDLLQPPGATSPSIVLPRPPQTDGAWQWSEPAGPDRATAATSTYDIAPADDAARFSDTPAVLRSGWLQLPNGRGRHGEAEH